MSNELLDKKLRLLVKALRADTFHFVLIINNHPSVYNDVVEWLKQHITDREIRELRLTGKPYRQVSDALQAAKQHIVTIPDFDELFTEENDDVRVALNQRRDFLAFQRMNLVCFLSPDTFRLLPKKIPDLWSLRSLELDIVYNIKEPLFTIPTTPFISSLGGTTIGEKEAEIRRLTYQLSQIEPANIALRKKLEAQLVTLQMEVPQRFEEATSLPDTSQKNIIAAEVIANYGLINKQYSPPNLNNVFFKHKLAISYSKLGDTHVQLGNFDKALTYFEECFRLEKELYEAYPNNVSFKNGLAISYSALGRFYRDHRNDSDIVKNYFQQAEKLWADLVSSSPQHAEFKQNLSWVKNQLQSLHS